MDEPGDGYVLLAAFDAPKVVRIETCLLRYLGLRERKFQAACTDCVADLHGDSVGLGRNGHRTRVVADCSNLNGRESVSSTHYPLTSSNGELAGLWQECGRTTSRGRCRSMTPNAFAQVSPPLPTTATNTR